MDIAETGDQLAQAHLKFNLYSARMRDLSHTLKRAEDQRKEFLVSVVDAFFRLETKALTTSEFDSILPERSRTALAQWKHERRRFR